jgi:hypothetical protein
MDLWGFGRPAKLLVQSQEKAKENEGLECAPQLAEKQRNSEEPNEENG